MSRKISILAIIFSIILNPLFSQEKSKRALKEEKKIEKQQQVEALVNSKEFTFIAKKAQPQGSRSIDLSTNQGTVKFHPEMVESDMPFFGRAYSGAGYGGDSGMKFKGNPDEFTVVKKKNNYQVSAVVKGERDTYKLFLSISISGSASLSISSNNRSYIGFPVELVKCL